MFALSPHRIAAIRLLRRALRPGDRQMAKYFLNFPEAPNKEEAFGIIFSGTYSSLSDLKFVDISQANAKNPAFDLLKRIVDEARSAAEQGHPQQWIGDERGDSYEVRGADVPVDNLWRVELIKGEPVQFYRGPDRITKNGPNKGKAHRTAVRITRSFIDNTEDPETHREVCKVRDKQFLIRPRGGFLAIPAPWNDILQAGMIVECGVQENSGFQTWRPKDIVILADSEEEYEASLSRGAAPKLSDTFSSIS